MSLSYDDRQLAGERRVCAGCQREYYMRGALCGWCQPIRTTQTPPPARLDVNGAEITGP